MENMQEVNRQIIRFIIKERLAFEGMEEALATQFSNSDIVKFKGQTMWEILGSLYAGDIMELGKQVQAKYFLHSLFMTKDPSLHQ